MRYWKWLFRLVLVVILFASAIEFRVIDLDQLMQIFRSPALFLSQLVLFLIIHLVLTYRWKKILEELGIHQDYFTTLRDQFLSNIVALFFGNAATKEVVKSAALCRRNPQKKTIAVVSVLLDRLLGLASFLVVGFLAVLPFWQSWRTIKYLSLVPYLMSLGVLVIPIIFWGSSLWGSLLSRSKFRNLKGLNQIASKLIGKKMLLWLALGLVSPILSTIQVTLLSQSLGNHLGLLLIVVPLITITQNLSFLPLGLGINQWVAFKVFEWAGAGEGNNIATAITALQLYTIIFTLLSGAVLGFKGKKKQPN